MSEIISFSIPADIIFGIDSLMKLGDVIHSKGNKAIIITEPMFYDNKLIGQIEQLLKSFNIDYIIYDEINADSGSEDISNIAILAQTARVDVIIGLGGQKCLNIAKAVGLIAPHEKSFYYYLKHPEELDEKIPVILLPTTIRDYFALSDMIYYKDQDIGYSRIFTHPKLYSDYVIIDPILSADIPKNIMTLMLIEMLGFAIDSVLSPKSSIFTDTLLFKTIETINSNFDHILEFPDDLEVRKNICLGGLFLMFAGRITGFGLLQTLVLGLNSYLKIPKLSIVMPVLPHILEFLVQSAPEKFVKIANCLNLATKNGSVVESALKVPEYFQIMADTHKIPSRLSEFGVVKEVLYKLADHSINFPFYSNTLKVISKEDIYNILYSSL
ncbi:MAG: iron-containing alcohol dehydrogenase [Exilispira sp.]|jgi:alcohol dehydrogenase|nr:iron-containing alcohol dehydrogenase [Exilispira sp.]